MGAYGNIENPLSQLTLLAYELRDKSKKYKDAAKTTLDQATNLDSAAQDLATDPAQWAGKGAQAFLTAWKDFHRRTITAALTLEATAQALDRLAGKIDDYVQNAEWLTIQAVGLGLLTVGLTIFDLL